MTLDLVSSCTGDGVDVTGREPAVLDIEWGQFEGYILNGVIGERLALGRIAVAVQPEVVIHLDAVHREAVETGIGTNTLHRTNEGFVNVDAWINPNDITNIAIEGRQILQIVKIKAG